MTRFGYLRLAPEIELGRFGSRGNPTYLGIWATVPIAYPGFEKPDER
jgi:hypothetical protein